jgi:conjugal transfer pilus assembly protein TraV
MQRLAYLVLFIAVISLSACASVMNPYKGEFSCPETSKGKCVGVPDAYDESVEGNEPQSGTEGSPGLDEEAASAEGEAGYEAERYRELAELVKEPVTPMMAPPEVRRILFLPYRGADGELMMMRYVYFFIEEPRWILGDYLTGEGK